MAAVRLILHGKVQGVFYRDWTVSTARGLGLTGWVRNRWNGGVEAVAEGPEEDIEAFKRVLNRGPQMSNVTKLDIRTEEATGEFVGFKIKRTG